MTDTEEWNISFRLSRDTRFKKDDETWFDQDHIKGEIITWLEDIDFRVDELEVTKLNSLLGFTVGDDEEGIAGGECPNCEKGELIADSQSFEEGTIDCSENCGFTIYSKNRGWFITDIVIDFEDEMVREVDS
jgi:hypothetical protein